MLSLTASIIETILVKTSVFAFNQFVNLASYSGYSIYNWYNPTVTPMELMQKEIEDLRSEIMDLRGVENTVMVLE